MSLQEQRRQRPSTLDRPNLEELNRVLSMR
jgi:hypothetical protein